jgi:hypothetical protein
MSICKRLPFLTGLAGNGSTLFEDPAASCRESSTVRNPAFFKIRSLTPPQAAGNGLAFAVQLAPAVQASIHQPPTTRVLKNKHQAVSQGERH